MLCYPVLLQEHFVLRSPSAKSIIEIRETVLFLNGSVKAVNEMCTELASRMCMVLQQHATYLVEEIYLLMSNYCPSNSYKKRYEYSFQHNIWILISFNSLGNAEFVW